jgi:hypothetical protein
MGLIFGIILGCFIFRSHFWIHCDTNGCADFTDFTDWYGFFLFFAGNKALEFKKNPYQSVKSVKSVHPFVSQCIQKCNLLFALYETSQKIQFNPNSSAPTTVLRAFPLPRASNLDHNLNIFAKIGAPPAYPST